ncbi:MAG: hypothetical protein IJA30_01615 [Bacilli bacterium]|nr:hypothetical protein [Bacilli bacterium]
MQKKLFKLLKLVAIFCVVILVIELIYIIYLLQGKSIYFDGINSVINVDKGYVAVGSNNNNDKYYEKAKITKYNNKKEKIFEKLYNKGYNGVFFDVILDQEENLIAVGSFESSEEYHLEGRRIGLIVKYDKDGNLLYENTFKVLDNTKFTSVEVMEDSYIVTGQSVYSDMKVGFSSDGGAFVMKYDKELKLVWKNNYGDSKTSSYNDVAIYKDDIYVVGVTSNNIGIISKYNDKGKLLDTSKYKYTDDLGFTGIVCYDKHFYVTGGKKNVNTSDVDAVIVKYERDLDVDEEIVYEDKGFERFNQVIVDKNNNLVVVGTTAEVNKVDSSESVNVFTHDGLIGKYDKDLEKVSVVRYGDDRDDYFTDVIVSDGNYLVSGYSSYEDGSYLNKFITYSDALKTLGVE